jgi:hypothetical protein
MAGQAVVMLTERAGALDGSDREAARFRCWLGDVKPL